jgi:hypothetical protein
LKRCAIAFLSFEWMVKNVRNIIPNVMHWDKKIARLWKVSNIHTLTPLGKE